MLTPSIVGIDERGEALVGRTAREFQVLHPDRTASLFKRYMGTDWKFECDGKTYTPEQLSSLVLRSLKADAEAHLGQPIARAVITCPAYFNDLQRKATIRAGQLAGLTVERILNEPTAAAIAYGLHESHEDKIIAVFDLGRRHVRYFDRRAVRRLDRGAGVVRRVLSRGRGFHPHAGRPRARPAGTDVRADRARCPALGKPHDPALRAGQTATDQPGPGDGSHSEQAGRRARRRPDRGRHPRAIPEVDRAHPQPRRAAHPPLPGRCEPETERPRAR